MAASTGGLAGVGLGFLIADGRVAPLLAVPLFGLALALLVRWIVPDDARARVSAVIALSFALHIAVAVVLYTGALAIGRGGFITGDDAAYANIAWRFVQYLNGEPQAPWFPPSWNGDAYLFGTWVYLQSAIFLLIGQEVLVPIMLNGVFALAMALLVYDMTRRLFDRRAAFIALVLTAFFPSLVVWSSLNLKDALALLLIGLCLWSLVRFQESPRWWPLAFAFAVLIPMESLRRYLFVGLALLIPIVVVLTPRLGLAGRLRWGVPALALSSVFLTAIQAGAGLGPQVLQTLESTRENMGAGARTRFVDAPPVRVNEGDTFVVVAPSPSATAMPPLSPRIVHVISDTRIVVVMDPPSSTPPVGTVFVRPGDVVVVGDPATTAAPMSQRKVISGSTPEVQLRSAEVGGDTAAVRTIAFLPIGLAHALFAPFPWTISRPAELAVLPDMLAWYVALVAAVGTLIHHRHRWHALFVLAGFAGGILLLLALVEGNVGTLYRHRAMALPWILLLASPSLAGLGLFFSRRPVSGTLATPATDVKPRDELR